MLDNSVFHCMVLYHHLSSRKELDVHLPSHRISWQDRSDELFDKVKSGDAKPFLLRRTHMYGKESHSSPYRSRVVVTSSRVRVTPAVSVWLFDTPEIVVNWLCDVTPLPSAWAFRKSSTYEWIMIKWNKEVNRLHINLQEINLNGCSTKKS